MHSILFNKYQSAYNHYISNGRKQADWHKFTEAWKNLVDFVAENNLNY